MSDTFAADLLSALQLCDDALQGVADVKAEIAAAMRVLPLDYAKMRAYLLDTLEVLSVVEARLNTASNQIRLA